MKGKTYVMADLHGGYDKYCRMLDEIGFSDEDRLYILGDMVDRGLHGIRIVQDVMKRSNITALLGNHDDTMCRLLGVNPNKLAEEKKLAYMAATKAWLSDGGTPTYAEYIRLSKEERQEVLGYIGSLAWYKELTIDDQKYFLAHTVPGIEEFNARESWGKELFTWGSPDYKQTYLDDMVIITGHTPTELIEEKSAGKIWCANNHVAIDCGAFLGHPLGCLCLETKKEIYVG